MSKLQSLNITLERVPSPGGRKVLANFHLMSVLRFHRYERVRLNGNRGTMFWCDSVPSELAERIERSSNAVILASRSQYAPEQVGKVVFVGDTRYRTQD